MRPLPLGVAVASVMVSALAVAVLVGGTGQSRSQPGPPVQSTSPGTVGDQYARAVDAAHRHGLSVWVESDLVKRWLAGPDSFTAAVATIGVLAARPGVVGIKIADELGYRDGLTTPARIESFLRESRAALATAAPGKLLLADVVVPALGCLPEHSPPLRWATICSVQQRGAYPQLSLDAMDGYLRLGCLDVLDVSTGLLTGATYAGWGVDVDTAQRTAWAEIKRRGWDALVRLQARKAMAHPGAYTATAAQANADVSTYVDIPRAQGAQAVDVWAWRQLYQGELYRLMDPRLTSNALWQNLVSRKAAGAHLFTHLSPASLEVGLDTDLSALAGAFTDLFVAAGTG